MRGLCSRININATLSGDGKPLFSRFVNTNIQLLLINTNFFVLFLSSFL